MRSTSLILIVALGLVASGSAGCVANDGPALIVGGAVLFDDTCTAEPDDPTLLIGPGSFNTQLGGAYTVFPVLQSQLVNAGGAGVANPNAILVTGAEVELREPGGAAIDFGGLQNPFTVDVSVTVPSATGSAPGAAIAGVTVIPPSHARGLDLLLGDDPNASMTVVAAVQLFGETVGGVDIEAAPWTWPINVFQGGYNVACIGTVELEGCLPCQDGNPCLRACRACTPETIVDDCVAGEQCVSNICTRPCATDAECGSGGFCISGFCI
jgi:hypothetical protein